MSSAGTGLSVVLVTYNSEDCVGPALRALASALPAAEAIVVDNGSSDATVAAVEAASPATKVVSGHGNVGFGDGCNRGVAVAANAHVLLLNPDTRVVAADGAALQELMDAPTLGLVVPLLGADGSAPRHQLFRERSWVGESLDHVAGSLWPRGWARGRPLAGPDDEGWASGAALLVRREEFDRVGGFDGRFFLFYEDRDLSKRYRRAGFPLRTTDAMTGEHAGGGSSAPDALEAFRLACTVLGWVEYLAKWQGEARARRAARLMLITLALVQGVSALAALGGAARLVRKRRQLRALGWLLGGGRLGLAPDRYPAARRLFAELSGGPVGGLAVPHREP